MNMETKELMVAKAKVVIIATGGAGRMHYQGFPTSNHYGATADGLVLAYRAGAKLMYQDSLQYHPTGTAYPSQILGALVTEKVRSLGAKLVNSKGEVYNLFEKLAQLLKDGDVLKYGELVYTVGTPDGEKWAKELYDERIEYYGEELLSKYIVDGEFNKAQVEEDSSNAIAEAERLEIMDDDAYKAYHSNYLDDTEKIFSEMGFYTVVKNKKLFVFIQKEKLANLDLADKGSYKLRLAKRRNYEHEEGDIPTYDDNVTGFALEKIECETFDHSSRFAKTDAELIDKINALIEAGQFDTDRIRISITSSAALSEDVFKDMNYETINVTRKYQTSAFAWLSVKYENINLEALKEISNMNTIKSINIYLENEVPELAG